ncbi:MAG: epoxyqueuosine reductase QueH [Bacteroidales bacterium]|nr:epoxyqueuosine reductase QueH [Bacteroidales bacterium]
MKINYQKELDKIILGLEEENKNSEAKRLLLHSCCAPCSSYVLEYLANYLAITIYYYNPNIFPKEEFYSRADEQEKLISQLATKYPITFIKGDYDSKVFYHAVAGLEDEKEGGERCFVCYELRLREAAKMAKEKGYDFFTTTLSISPLKNAEKLNEIGERLGEEYGVSYLFSDFKKKSGYQRSIELSSQYGLYRQNYCGCVFSKKEREDYEKNSLQ